MSHPVIATSAPMPFPRRAFHWCLAQVKHVLPATIFFFIGFNLILWTKRMILEEHGIDYRGFFTATIAALLVGKAVLVTDHLPFMRRFDGAPMIWPILFKSAIYWLCVLIVRLAEALLRFLAAGGAITDFPDFLVERFSWSRFVHSDMVDGAVLHVRHNTRPQHAFRRRRALPLVLPLALIRSQAHPPATDTITH